MPILLKEKWHSGKRPTLQISILKFIAINGNITRKIAEMEFQSHYGDVHKAFKILEEKKLIEQFSNTLGKDGKEYEYVNKGKTYRPSELYRLTKKGFIAFIELDDFKPDQFWKVLLSYCNFGDDIIQKEILTEFCSRYYQIYLGKRLEDIYLQSNLDFFYKLFEKEYLKNYKIKNLKEGYHKDIIKILEKNIDDWDNIRQFIFFKDMNEAGINIPPDFDTSKKDEILTKYYRIVTSYIFEIPNVRYVLETLALKRGITKTEIAKETGLSSDKIDIVFKNHSLESYASSLTKDIDVNSVYEETDDLLNEYTNFIDHALIVKSTAKKKVPKYELSLFGAIYIIKLLKEDTENYSRYNKYDETVRMTITNFYSLFLSLISKNYKDKLPLVFGKKSKIEKTHFSIDDILNLVISGNDSKRYLLSSSILIGGCQEIYNAINHISIEISKKLYDIFDKIPSLRISKNDSDKIKFCKKLIREERDKITVFLNYVNIIDFLKLIQKDHDNSYHFNSTQDLFAKEMKIMEEMFSKEITFLSYIWLLNKYNENNFFVLEKPFVVHSTSKIKSIFGPTTEFYDLAELDKDIQKQYMWWIEDVIDYNNRTDAMIKTIYNKFKI